MRGRLPGAGRDAAPAARPVVVDRPGVLRAGRRLRPGRRRAARARWRRCSSSCRRPATSACTWWSPGAAAERAGRCSSRCCGRLRELAHARRDPVRRPRRGAADRHRTSRSRMPPGRANLVNRRDGARLVQLGVPAADAVSSRPWSVVGAGAGVDPVAWPIAGVRRPAPPRPPVSAKPISGSSAAAAKTTPSTVPSEVISGPPELPLRTRPRIV